MPESPSSIFEAKAARGARERQLWDWRSAQGRQGRWARLGSKALLCDGKIGNAVAEELAVEHCSFYGDKTSKAVKGFFLNQVYCSWGHTAHRGWARLLLDRRSLVQVPNAPRRRARADNRYYEENIMESFFSFFFECQYLSVSRQGSI